MNIFLSDAWVQFRSLLPLMPYILLYCGSIFLTWFITKVYIDHRWKADIANHLGEITKAELVVRDKRISKQDVKIAKTERENEQLSVARRAALVMANKTVEILAGAYPEEKRIVRIQKKAAK